MDEKRDSVKSNLKEASSLSQDEQPLDPSNTSSIGQKVEQGVIDTKAGISEQSAKWEDEQERSSAKNVQENRAKQYAKHPSPEENNIDKEQEEAE